MVTLTDKEFDDILQRNKNVSSGAIMRAVQDASEGSLTVSLSPMCVCVLAAVHDAVKVCKTMNLFLFSSLSVLY